MTVSREPFDGRTDLRSSWLDALAHPRRAHHRGDAEILGAPVQIGRRHLEQRQHDLERLAVPSVLAPQRRQLLHVAGPRRPRCRPCRPTRRTAARPGAAPPPIRRRTGSAPARSGAARASARAPGSNDRSRTPIRPATAHAAPGSSRRAACLGAEILPQQVEFLAHPAGADCQRHPTSGNDRRGRHLFGDLHQRASRRDVDGVGEPQPTGHRRHRTDQDPRIRPCCLRRPRRASGR